MTTALRAITAAVAWMGAAVKRPMCWWCTRRTVAAVRWRQLQLPALRVPLRTKRAPPPRRTYALMIDWRGPQLRPLPPPRSLEEHPCPRYPGRLFSQVLHWGGRRHHGPPAPPSHSSSVSPGLPSPPPPLSCRRAPPPLPTTTAQVQPPNGQATPPTPTSSSSGQAPPPPPTSCGRELPPTSSGRALQWGPRTARVPREARAAGGAGASTAGEGPGGSVASGRT